MDTTTPTPTASTEIRSAKEMLKALRAAFPVFAEFKPLAIGIDKQVMAARPEFAKKLLRPAMLPAMRHFHQRWLEGIAGAATDPGASGS